MAIGKINSFQTFESLELAKNNGLELLKFDDLFLDVSKEFRKIKKREISTFGQYPVVDQSEEYIAGFTDVTPLSLDNVERIVFGDHSKTIKYIDFPFVKGADGTKVLKLKNDNYITKYFFYFLKTLNLPDAGYSRYFRYLSDSIIPVPSIQMQEKVVKLFDDVSNLIAKRREQINALDEMVKSLFMEIFEQSEGELVQLKKVASIETNTVENFTPYSEEYYLGVEDIEKTTGKILKKVRVKDVDIKSSKNRFTRDAILYSKIRPYLNKVASPNFDGLASTDVFPIMCGEKVNKYYLLNVLRSEKFVLYSTINSSGANIPRVNRKTVENYTFILPPIALQNRFADYVTAIEAQKESLRASLSELETLFDALMQAAFSGHLNQYH